MTAARAGLLVCHACGLLNRFKPGNHELACMRCGASLHFRKPASIVRTWALLITAYALYIPANRLPILRTESLFNAQSDTIMSGVIFLWRGGSWPIATIIFLASILLPLVKLAVLTFIVVTVQRRSTWRPAARTRLYQVVDAVGRWSMVDIYVTSILVAIVHFRTLATITAGPGAVAFGALVMVTMLAAMSFDPRLIWDPVEADRG
jgi:paraquat-inducible protein A